MEDEDMTCVFCGKSPTKFCTACAIEYCEECRMTHQANHEFIVEAMGIDENKESYE
jgi:hypothetical protein